MNPSVMILVKNEAYWLPYTLKQTEGHFSHYVIYDVGSTDNTREIIDWWASRMANKAELFIRYLPHVDPKVQGCFRNSMIVEGQQDVYFILDGDELYPEKDLVKISTAANKLNQHHKENEKIKFGVFNRIEMSEDLTKRYSEIRSHHRLYTKNAHWLGTHPGEIPAYKQNSKSEIWFNNITCYHLHNTLRSPKEEDATKRIQRKSQKTYHPGELIHISLLNNLPVLKTQIENFPVSPALKNLWEKIL